MRLPRLSTLDFKLGIRILARYPGLTIVGTFAIAVAIALGTIYFEAVNKWQNPVMPVENGSRIVQIRNWDIQRFGTEARLLNDFAVWRGEVKAIEQLGAAVSFVRNLSTDDGRIEPVSGAEVTAAAFRVMAAAPALGRALTTQDEQPGEAPVVVIGHRLWQNRFGGDPGILGKNVKLGTQNATVVGVMPEGFAFPMNQRIWAPLRVNGATLPPRSGPHVTVFGRLAPGSSIDDARAELEVIGARLSAGNRVTHEHLRPRVTTFAKPLAEGGEMMLVRNVLYGVNTVFLMLLAIICTNVATLVFARTATRSWEITVRSALGASRGRIIGQLFTEALVLTLLAAAVGLVLARVAMGLGLSQFAAGSDALPFWIDASLSWRTFIYAALLATFGAAIVGVLPALRVTRVNINDALRGEAAGRSGLRFGGFWTAIIVVQVAITVMFLPLAGGGVFESNRFSQRAEGIGADRYIKANVVIEPEEHGLDSAAFTVRQRRSFDELERRLGAEPGVTGVAFASRLPVEDQFKYRIEVDTAGRALTPGLLRTSTLVLVSSGFFRTFGTSIVAGRDFERLDFEGRSRVIIVNEAFARNVLGQPNAIGHRIRIGEGEVNYHTGDEWYEIVGVVKNFGWQLPRPEEQSALYVPRLPAGLQLVAQVRDPIAFTNRLRAIAAEVDPTIRLTEVAPLTKAGGGEAEINWTLTAVAFLVGFIVLTLSATGIHALMSFTVARRTREIGIRAALGASRGKIVAGIFSRAFVQISLGLAVGSGLAFWAGLGSTRALLLLLASDAIMFVVGLAACAVPLLRALRVDPTEALRAEA